MKNILTDKRKPKYIFLTVLFFVALLAYVLYYGSFVFKFDAHQFLYSHGGAIVLVGVNVLIFSVFLIFLGARGKASWKEHSFSVAFFISLFTEMFGFPLMAYLLSPHINYLVLKNYYPFSVINLYNISSLDPLNIIFCSLGIIGIISGMILIFAGWKQVYSSKGFCKKGLYKYVRHSQYTGFFLITFSWLIVWPALITWVMWPVLLYMYWCQAKKEERLMIKEQGKEYKDYLRKTKMFIPFVY